MLNLRRITRDGRWIPEVDGLRFLAIASVFLFHLSGELANRSGRLIPIEPRFHWLQRLLTDGDRGVSLFFVISGMILALPYARQHLLGARPVSLRKYYLRRLTRLEPPYLASLLLILVLTLIYSHLHLPTGYFVHLLATAFYQHNLTFANMSSVNPVTWSLEVEIQFYIFAPLVMLLFRIRAHLVRRVVMLAAILVIGLAQIPFVHTSHVILSIAFYLQYFLAGLFVADVFTLNLETMPSSWLWDLLGLAALACVFTTPHDATWPHVLNPFPVLLLCIAAMRSFALRRVLAFSPIALLGGMCYSIYLLHFIFIAAFFKLTRHAIVPSFSFPANLALQLLVTGVPTILLCVAFFVLIERPCMDPDWPSHLYHRLTGRNPAEAAALDTKGIAG